ncbi:unnamed protein product [Prunus brigantina]
MGLLVWMAWCPSLNLLGMKPLSQLVEIFGRSRLKVRRKRLSELLEEIHTACFPSDK